MAYLKIVINDLLTVKKNKDSYRRHLAESLSLKKWYYFSVTILSAFGGLKETGPVIICRIVSVYSLSKVHVKDQII